MCCMYLIYFFFFKQKTAYEMRISDWSSDVCSSDLEGSRAEDIAVAVANLDQADARLESARTALDDTGLKAPADGIILRSEERRVGKECVSTCSSRWSPDH